MPASFWHYDLTNEVEQAGQKIISPVCLSERVKKGTYRGTIDTCIPYSQISGALTARFNQQYHAIGVFPPNFQPSIESYAFALQDVARGVAKLTLDVSALGHVRATVFVWRDPNDADTLPGSFDMRLGALRSKGFGLCRLANKRAVAPDEQAIVAGVLRSRIPESQLNKFELQSERPLYGYLFEPDATRMNGRYTRALMEGSLVRGPKFLVHERSV
jgi:hypothetical protein